MAMAWASADAGAPMRPAPGSSLCGESLATAPAFPRAEAWYHYQKPARIARVLCRWSCRPLRQSLCTAFLGSCDAAVPRRNDIDAQAGRSPEPDDLSSYCRTDALGYYQGTGCRELSARSGIAATRTGAAGSRTRSSWVPRCSTPCVASGVIGNAVMLCGLLVFGNSV